MSIMPQDPDSKTDTPPSEACACGCDETDHGDVTGCIHCGRCWEYIPRSSYVSVEQDRAAADPANRAEAHYAGMQAARDMAFDWYCPRRSGRVPRRECVECTAEVALGAAMAVLFGDV